MGNYTILVHALALEKLDAYIEGVEGGEEPGSYVQRQLQQREPPANREEWLEVLLQTKFPQIFAESSVSGDGSDWSLEELSILGDIGIATPVTVFDNGRHHRPKIHDEPFEGTLLFIPGALLRSNGDALPADWPEVVRDDALDQEAYNRLYARRLLPLLGYADERCAERGTQALISVPGLGCGQFAGRFRGRLGEALREALMALLEEHAHRFPHIRCVYYDPYQECQNERHEYGHISLLIRPLTQGNEGKSQLCLPHEFEDEGDDFGECELFSVVAWDHVSWPGNDFYGGSRATDDGVKAAATSAMTAMTGVVGSYDKRYGQYDPPAPCRDWAEVVERHGLQLVVDDNLWVFSPEETETSGAEDEGEEGEESDFVLGDFYVPHEIAQQAFRGFGSGYASSIYEEGEALQVSLPAGLEQLNWQRLRALAPKADHWKKAGLVLLIALPFSFAMEDFRDEGLLIGLAVAMVVGLALLGSWAFRVWGHAAQITEQIIVSRDGLLTQESALLWSEIASIAQDPSGNVLLTLMGDSAKRRGISTWSLSRSRWGDQRFSMLLLQLKVLYEHFEQLQRGLHRALALFDPSASLSEAQERALTQQVYSKAFADEMRWAKEPHWKCQEPGPIPEAFRLAWELSGPEVWRAGEPFIPTLLRKLSSRRTPKQMQALVSDFVQDPSLSAQEYGHRLGQIASAARDVPPILHLFLREPSLLHDAFELLHGETLGLSNLCEALQQKGRLMEQLEGILPHPGPQREQTLDALLFASEEAMKELFEEHEETLVNWLLQEPLAALGLELLGEYGSSHALLELQVFLSDGEGDDQLSEMAPWIRDAIRTLQERVELDGEAGQLSLSGASAGEGGLALSEASPGQVSLASDHQESPES